MTSRYHLLALTLLLCTLVQLSTQKKTFPRLPLEVIQVMGSRAMRYHHFLWHNLREYWPLLDNETRQGITDLGWAPPRPSLKYDAVGNYTPIEDNGSGEDFLYMHKQMVKHTNEILAGLNNTDYKKVVGFKSFPTPDDEEYPVPCRYVIPGKENEGFTSLVNDVKSEKFYNEKIVPTEKQLKDPEVLRNLTLGAFGSKVEYTVHTWMHLRLSKKTPYGVRPPLQNLVPDIDEKWDDLTYQWLADTFSSHVNPIFWRIHGWVEDRIEDWKKANGIEEIDWQNTWEGGPEGNISDMFAINLRSNLALKDPNPPTDGQARVLMEEGDHMHMGGMERMNKVFNLLMKGTGGKESVMYKKVNVSPFPSST